MGLIKYDHPPLLAPGRHYMTLAQLEARFVHPFSGAARSCREKLFYSFEGLIQRLLVAKIRCDLFIDGSFLTQKQEPDDIDVIVSVEHGIFIQLSDQQMQLLEEINVTDLAPVDSAALTTYPRDHERFGTAADLGNAGEIYGLEHGQAWLKGYVVIRLWETDVRNRICR
jgi:hypothetical protein